MSTAISKWGNSLALRLQRNVVERANMREGTLVDIEVSGNRLVVTQARPKYTLEELLAQMRPEKQRRRETDCRLEAQGGRMPFL